MFPFYPGSAACKGDSGGPLVQKSGRQIYLLGIVSYGPKNCRDNEDRRPDIYTDIRTYARYIRSETAYYDKSQWSTQMPPSASSVEPTPPDGLAQLVPQCGEVYCFRSDTGECTFVPSFYVRCKDTVTCDRRLIPDDAALVSGGKGTFTASSVGAVGPRTTMRRSGTPIKLCTRWKYVRKRWRCRSYRRINGRRRRESEGDQYLSLLVCPVLTCIGGTAISNEWSTPDQCPELQEDDVFLPSPPTNAKGTNINKEPV